MRNPTTMLSALCLAAIAAATAVPGSLGNRLPAQAAKVAAMPTHSPIDLRESELGSSMAGA